MQCRDIEQMLAAREAKQLPHRERQALSAHLAGCPSCRKLANAVEAGRAAMQSLPPAAPPPSLRRAVVSGQRRVVRRRLAPVAVALATATAALLWWTTRPAPAPEPDPAMTESLSRLAEARREYEKAIAELEAEVDRQSDTWPPEVRDTYETNIAIIDDAIADTQAAAEAHGHPEGMRFVLAAYEQKVDLLTEAAGWRFKGRTP